MYIKIGLYSYFNKMTPNPQSIFPKYEVFDSNLLPVPFDGLDVTTRDADNNPTTIKFYKDAKITAGVIGGTHVMTMELIWEHTNKIKTAVTTVIPL